MTLQRKIRISRVWSYDAYIYGTPDVIGYSRQTEEIPLAVWEEYQQAKQAYFASLLKLDACFEP